MENLIYTTSTNGILEFIANQQRSYKINIDCKDSINYYDSLNIPLNHHVFNTVFIKHTEITPIYRIIKRNADTNVIKVIIPSYTIYFPQFNNIKYTFKQTSINLIIQNSRFVIEYDDIIEFFDNGINNYLKRTIKSILSKKYLSNCGRSLFCSSYSVSVTPYDYNSILISL